MPVPWGGLAGGEAAFKNVPSVIRLSLSLVSPTLGSGCTHTQRKKVGSLLSSCWQLTKTMPIHSLGIEALSRLDRTPFLLALEGGDTLSLHSFTMNKNDLTEQLCTAVELRG